MSTIKIDVSNPDLGKQPDFHPFPTGKYQFCVSKPLIITKAQKTENMIINLELEISDGEYKGRKVFDRLTLIKSSEWKTYQFAACLGIDIKSSGGEIDLEEFTGRVGECMIGQETYTKPTGETVLKNVVTRYLFEPEKK
jgi:hypothetical protein